MQYFQTGEKESGKLRGAGTKISDRQNDQPRPDYIRNNTVCWLNRSEDTSWIYDKLSALLTAINSQKYHFAIDTIQTIQLAEYTAGVNHESGQFYKPHIDTCLTGWIDTQRKLSLTIQLTPPENYEGGDLLLFGDKNDLILNQANYSKNIQQRREFLAAVDLSFIS